ncbi:conjugal transfer protein TraD, partial [Kingella kingae]|uniref:conjugal transfer protein TraD n=1 Tax=Kingella kingae TaxID=504 RepID=UPI00255360AA
FVQLAEKYLSGAEMSAGDLSGLKTLAQAEQLEEKLQNAKAAARKVATTENEKIRKARTHELIKSAGLLVKAGLVDGKTGKPRTSSPEI